MARIGWVRPLWVLPLAVALGCWTWGHIAAGQELPDSLTRPTGSGSGLENVGALGRLEPQHGVIRVAGPPRTVAVIQELLVEEGDQLDAGQPIAVLVGIDLLRADVERLESELANAESEWTRNEDLFQKGVLADTKWEEIGLARQVARTNLARARADLALSTVRAPIDGRVLEIHARGGERVGVEGVAELGATQSMYAVAEVYETDIARVRVGQRAHIRSPALRQPLQGEVERIGLKIDKKDVLSTDPVADADARVVEVHIRLDDSAAAAALTNLRVTIEIEAGGGDRPGQ